MIRLAIIAVTVIPAVMLTIICANNSVTVISENEFYFFRVRHVVHVPAGGNFYEKTCFCNLKKLRSIEKRRYLDGFEPQECPRTVSFDKNMTNAPVNISNRLLEPEL